MKTMNELDRKLIDAFDGKVLRKDLLHRIKKGTNVPTFVLEFLLARFCASDDQAEMDSGMEAVIASLQDNYVKPDEANAAQSAHESAQAAAEAARGEVARANADYAALISQRNNLQLVSPVDGLVVARDAEPGATVVAGQSVFRLIDPATLWIRTRIDQGRFQGIAVGQPAIIVLRSQPDKQLAGKVVRLEVQADSVTEERFVNVAFNEAPGVLPLGELAEVTIDFPPVANALVVPAAAVKKQGKQNGVWLLEGSTLRFQPVEIGAQSLDGKVQILKGISLQDNVVVYSQQLLSDGMKVRAVKQP